MELQNSIIKSAYAIDINDLAIGAALLPRSINVKVRRGATATDYLSVHD